MNALWAGVMTHLWQTTLVLALVAALARALKRAPARYLEGLWTVGLLKLLLPLPLVAGSWPALTRLGETAGRQQTIGPAVKTLSQLAYPEMLWVDPTDAAAAVLSPTVLRIATLSWLGGAALLLVVSWFRGRAAVPRGDAPWHGSDAVVERVTRAAHAVGIPLARIRITDDAIVPCVRSLRRTIVLLPRSVVETLRPEELRAVLLHENAHYRRRDIWRNAAQRLVTCLFFFYPPAWWLARRLRESAEMACDEAVLAAGIDARTYARALARTVVLELAPTAAPALGSNRSHLSVRLQRINTPERYDVMNRHRFAIIVALVAAVGFSFAPVADGAGLVAAVGEAPGGQEWQSAAQLRGLNGLEKVVTATYRDTPLARVLEEIGRRGGFGVYFTSGDDLTFNVQVDVVDTSIREVLNLLADLRGMEYLVVDPTSLIVRLTSEAAASGRAVRRQSGASVAEAVIPWEERVQSEIRKPPSPADGPIRVGGDIEEPELIYRVQPEYPQLARRARMEGFVLLECVIDRQGNVKNAEVLRGLGLGLDAAALDAVRQWKYTPTVYDGELVEVILTVNVTFTLIE